MLTDYALNSIRQHVKNSIAYAQYKINGVYYRSEIQKIEIKKNGDILFDFAIDSVNGACLVRGVQLYNHSGILLAEKTENIDLESGQMGVLYRFKINISES